MIDPAEAWVATGEARASFKPVQAKSGATFGASGEARALLQPLEARARGEARGSASAVAFSDGAVFADQVFEDRVFAAKDLPAITLEAVLDLGGKTDDGRIVLGVRDVWHELIDYFLRDPESLYEVDPRKMEEIIAGTWERSKRYDEVVLTPRSGDRGRDIIATKRGHGSIRIVNEVKAYNPGHVVTAEQVRAFITVIRGQAHSKGIITTTSDFAPRLMDNDEIKRDIPFVVELMPRDALLDWLKEIGAKDEHA
jgi:restriction system protein